MINAVTTHNANRVLAQVLVLTNLPSLIVYFLQDVKGCVDDLNGLLKVEPNNSAALKLLQDVQKKK